MKTHFVTHRSLVVRAAVFFTDLRRSAFGRKQLYAVTEVEVPLLDRKRL